MATRVSNTAATTALDALLALADSGFVRLYDGTQPATTATTVDGGDTLILEYALDADAFPASSADGTDATGGASSLPINDDALAAHNFATSGYGVLVDSSSNIILSGTVGATGSGETFEIANLSPALDDTVALTGCNVSLPQQET